MVHFAKKEKGEGDLYILICKVFPYCYVFFFWLTSPKSNPLTLALFRMVEQQRANGLQFFCIAKSCCILDRISTKQYHKSKFGILLPGGYLSQYIYIAYIVVVVASEQLHFAFWSSGTFSIVSLLQEMCLLVTNCPTQLLLLALQYTFLNYFPFFVCVLILTLLHYCYCG